MCSLLKTIDPEFIKETARTAGAEILGVYNSEEFNVEIKSDNSPLTKADTLSHATIKERLLSEYPDIPVLSEEGREIPYGQRRDWEMFWLVDPLDGTKEFIKRNGEFTVNIALIRRNEPVFGIIYAPALSLMYFGTVEIGAFKQSVDGDAQRLPLDHEHPDEIVAVQSRSHSSEEEIAVLKEFGVTKYISSGSSLKFCMVAEGKAHVYYRHGPTWEWDTAAGDAIARSAGAKVTGLRYNKDKLLNESFTVSRVL